MAHPLRFCTVGEIYHVTARGNNRQPIFDDDFDRREYIQLLYEVMRRYMIKTHAFVLMSNHVHLLLQPLEHGNLSVALQVLNSTYAKYINRRQDRIGHLFQGRFHSSHVNHDPYLLVVSRYIHNNPVKAGLVREASEYPWSSVRAFIGELDPGVSLDRLIERLVDTTLTLGLLGEGITQQRDTYRKLLVSDTASTFEKV